MHPILSPLWKPGLVWLLLLGPLFFATYGFANHWAAARPGVPSIVFGWEQHIPFVPWTIVPYWSIDIFYGLSLLICSSRLELARHARRLLTAQVICTAGFLLWPLRFSTPRPHVSGWAKGLFDALAGFDLPYNQAPSLHIVLLVVLWDFYRRRFHGWAKGLLHVWSALIGISVLTTYQHHFIDIPTGLMVGALCLWLWPLDGDRPRWQWTTSSSRLRLAGLYLTGSIGLALTACIGRSWWWLYWPAASLALVALCYSALGAGGYQKRPSGTHSLASRWLFLPYRVAAWLNSRCWTLGMANSVEVAPDMWLGRVPLPWEKDHRRFMHVVDLCSELSLRHPGVKVHGWLDLTEPAEEQLTAAAFAVETAIRRGPVLVCCALGVSRSAAVAATWLCLYGGSRTAAEAIRQIQTARPAIVINPPLRLIIERAVSATRYAA